MPDDLDQPDRPPCPDCGSTARTVRLEASTRIFAFARASAVLLKSVTASSSLVMQAVIIPGNRSSEGRLIEAVALPWFEIIRQLEADPSLAFKIPAQKWEEIIAGAYKKAGFDEVTLTPRSADLGRDVIAVKHGLGSVRVIDQVKAYAPGHLVTANDVRALMGVLQTDTASKGFLTTTSDFAPLLRKDPLIAPFMPSRLELIDGAKLLQRLTTIANST